MFHCFQDDFYIVLSIIGLQRCSYIGFVHFQLTLSTCLHSYSVFLNHKNSIYLLLFWHIEHMVAPAVREFGCSWTFSGVCQFYCRFIGCCKFHWTGCSTQPTRIINKDCECIPLDGSVGGECQSRLVTVSFSNTVVISPPPRWTTGQNITDESKLSLFVTFT